MRKAKKGWAAGWIPARDKTPPFSRREQRSCIAGVFRTEATMFPDKSYFLSRKVARTEQVRQGAGGEGKPISENLCAFGIPFLSPQSLRRKKLRAYLSSSIKDACGNPYLVSSESACSAFPRTRHLVNWMRHFSRTSTVLFVASMSNRTEKSSCKGYLVTSTASFVQDLPGSIRMGDWIVPFGLQQAREFQSHLCAMENTWSAVRSGKSTVWFGMALHDCSTTT